MKTKIVVMLISAFFILLTSCKKDAEKKECYTKKMMTKEVIIKNVDGITEGTVTTVKNGKKEVTKIKGTEAEVKAKIDALK